MTHPEGNLEEAVCRGRVLGASVCQAGELGFLPPRKQGIPDSPPSARRCPHACCAVLPPRTPSRSTGLGRPSGRHLFLPGTAEVFDRR